MNNKLKNIIKFFFTVILACSVFSLISCDEIENVVLESGLQSISITRMPDKLRYTQADTALDTTGLEVTAHYRSGYSKLLQLSDLVITGFRSTEYYTATETIFITYTDKENLTRQTSFQITNTDWDTSLQSISVTKMPDKIKYTKDDTVLDTTGLEVTAHYRSGNSELIPLSELTFSGFRSTEYYTATENIIVSYQDKNGVTRQTSFQISNTDWDTSLQSISVTKMPDKVKYSRADKELDTTGLEVTALHRSGYSVLLPVDKLTFTGFRSTEGFYTSSETIIVSYQDGEGVIRQTSFQITYTDLASISISSQPEKTRYTQNSPLDFTGLIVNATYQDNSSQPVFSPSILEFLHLVEWGEANETIISDEEYSKIVSYRGRDENNNKVNLTIPLMYQVDDDNNFVKDESGNRILVSQLEIIGFDDTFYGFTEGQQQVIVKYTELAEGSIPIERETAFNVKLASLAGLSMTTSPYKTHYAKNSVLDFDGMTLRASYTDGSTETVFSNAIYQNLSLSDEKKNEIENFIGGTGKTLSIPLEWKTDPNGKIIYRNGDWCPAREIIFSDYDSGASVTSQTVKVRYIDNWGSSTQESEASFGIYYEVLQGIIVNSDPIKRKYKRGEAFDFAGLNIKAQYTNGKIDDLFTDDVYKNLTTLTAEEKLKIGAYTGRDGNTVVPLKIPLEWKRDTDGTIVTDGGKNVPLREIVFEGFDSSKIISSQEVTITLKDYSEASPLVKQTKIGIGYVDMAGIQLSANPFKLKYHQSEPLDLSGIVLYAQYEDNSLEKLFDDEILETIKAGLTSVQASAIENYKGDIKLGEAWFKQLEPRSTDTSNRMTIPLNWKKNSDGEFVNAAGTVVSASSDEKVCVTGITVLGFNSTETAGSQNVRLRFVDNSAYGTLEKEVSFQITYKTLSGIQVISLPTYTGVKDEAISFDGLAIKAQYTDGTVKTIFSNEIYTNLPSGYKPASLGNKYNDANPLNIILEKDGDKVISQIIFKGFDTTVDPASQTVTVTYEEIGKTETVPAYTQYQLRDNHLRSISYVSGLKTNYKMDGETSSDSVGGLGQTGTNRNSYDMMQLKKISDWHFNADGMILSLNYNDGTKKELHFENTQNRLCYGASTQPGYAYVVDASNELLYMQRWANEKDTSTDERYKIKITGFDPLSAFLSAKNQQVQQTLTISYTEGDITVSTQVNIQYTFGKTYKETEIPVPDEKAGYIKFGDYPQYVKNNSIDVNKYLKYNVGFYEYYLGTDGNLYCPKYYNGVLTYYQVEPIYWRTLNTTTNQSNYYISAVVLDTAPFYTGKSDRQNKRTEEFKWVVDSENGRISYGTVYSTYDIGNGSYIYSTLRNWLNGDNINGDATYNGKGFVQTAFTTKAQEKLSSIPVTEMLNTSVYGNANKVGDADVIVNTSAGYADNFTLFEHSSVKVLIPSDYSSGKVDRSFFKFNTTSGGIADRIRGCNHLKFGSNDAYYNDYGDLDTPRKANSVLRVDRLKEKFSFAPSYFAGNVEKMWIASDIHTDPTNADSTTMKKNLRTSRSYNIYNTTEERIQSVDSTLHYGVMPIIQIKQ